MMSMTGFEGLEHTLQLTHIWINDLDERLEWNNKPRAYRLLKTVLHSLRDWLQLNEAVDLGAQLPTLLRGAYYEQWRPSTTPVRIRSEIHCHTRRRRSWLSLNCMRTKTAFLARVDEEGLLNWRALYGSGQIVRRSSGNARRTGPG
jgi:hypothetical protein